MDKAFKIKVFSEFKETAFQHRRFSYETFVAVMDRHVRTGVFKEQSVGYSYEGRPIRVLSAGHGPTKVLAWSQMHGNEPSSTLALLDVINYLESDDQQTNEILSAITITVIPLLNPDGFLRYDRRNAQGIDINRDARRLVSPEARLLMSEWEKLRPDFALNLHDQETRYYSLNPARHTPLAMLAPECSEDGRTTPAREKAMKVIASVKSLSGNTTIAKYDDTYTPTAFGDTFMGLGTASILIETGTIADIERNIPRSLVTLAIIKSLWSIATGEYLNHDIEEYNRMPLNQDFDGYFLIIKNITIHDTIGSYIADIAIDRVKTTCNPEDFADDFDDFRVANIGDLDGMRAIRTYDFKDWSLHLPHGEMRIGRNIDFDITYEDGSTTFNVSKIIDTIKNKML